MEATAPRLFAVVQEYAVAEGVLDAHVAAWGLVHEDGAVRMSSADGRREYRLGALERAAHWFTRRGECRATLVWVRGAEKEER